jgi:hypothetical protein
MEIPESIDKLTLETTADPFSAPPVSQQLSVDDLVFSLKQKLDFQSYKAFEEGSAFYKKDASSDKNVIKNILYLYNDVIAKAITASNIDDAHKADVTKALNTSINGVVLNIEAIHTFANTLNKNQNIIDVQKFLYIILGYVIDTIKRNQSTKI